MENKEDKIRPKSLSELVTVFTAGLAEGIGKGIAKAITNITQGEYDDSCNAYDMAFDIYGERGEYQEDISNLYYFLGVIEECQLLRFETPESYICLCPTNRTSISPELSDTIFKDCIHLSMQRVWAEIMKLQADYIKEVTSKDDE